MKIEVTPNHNRDLLCESINTGAAWSYGKLCRTTAYVTIDGVPFCKKHANRHVLNLIVDEKAELLKVGNDA